MGKTFVVIIIVLLALACGALGYEVMRQHTEKKGLKDRVDMLEAEMTTLIAARNAQPAVKWVTETMFEDLHAYLESIDERTKELAASQKELADKLAQLKKSGATGAPAGQVPAIDIPNLTDEQKKALQELIKKEGDARDMQRANVIKGMVRQRIKSDIDKVSEKLDLTPMQKDDISKLVDKQLEKGFKALIEAFTKGDLESAREQIRQLVEESDVAVKEILDPDQIEKLKELDPDGFGRREAERQKRD